MLSRTPQSPKAWSRHRHSFLVESFSVMAGILTTKYPQCAQDLFAYQKTIVHASRSFSGDYLVNYDLCYHRQVAATKSLKWSVSDFSLYNETLQEGLERFHDAGTA